MKISAIETGIELGIYMIWVFLAEHFPKGGLQYAKSILIVLNCINPVNTYLTF